MQMNEEVTGMRTLGEIRIRNTHLKEASYALWTMSGRPRQQPHGVCCKSAVTPVSLRRE